MKNLLGLCGFSLLLILLAGVELGAQNVYRVNRRSQWQQWQFPAGTLELRADGSITPMEFKTPVNAALDASRFTHKLGQEEVRGGVWKAGTNLAEAGNIIDGDLETLWKPDPDAPAEDWWIEIDLGRVVPATLIRLHFPDQEGARPLREFRVFGTDGKKQSVVQDIFLFDLLGGTTRWNEKTMVEFQLSAGELFRKAIYLLETAQAGTDIPTAFIPLQYIRVLIDAKSPDAALSEVEVFTFGENIALNIIERGGFVDDKVTGRAASLADGDVNTSLNSDMRGKGEQVRYDWDLGAVFWLNRVIFISDQVASTWFDPGITVEHQILGSDGTLSPSGEIDFDILFDFVAPKDWNSPEHLTYLLLPYRRLRYFSAFFNKQTSSLTTGALSEVAFFPVGHVAKVGMASDFIEIAKQPKLLKTLKWEADLPPGTRVQAHTRSGNTLVERTLYYDRSGNEVSKEKYEGLTKSKRGETVEVVEPGEEWSGWSNVYQFSGQEFLSPSPRRYVQFKLILSSDRPQTAPTLNSLSLDFSDAFLAGARGEINPKEAVPGVAQKFTYFLRPEFSSENSGFNRILLETPSQADSLSIRIDGSRVELAAVWISPDSLIVELPQVVRRDEVEIDMHVNVLENPYLFNAFVGHTDEPALWQLVDPASRFAVTVFLPEIAEVRNLIAKVSIRPPIVTPNRDGVGDEARIRFAALKADVPAEVRIYSLDGALVQELEGGRGADGFQIYNWSGLDRSGARVAPGIYLCRIKLDAQAGAETLVRLIHVAY